MHALIDEIDGGRPNCTLKTPGIRFGFAQNKKISYLSFVFFFFQMNNQGADALINPLHALALAARPRPNPPLPVLRSPPPQPNFSPSTELLSPVLPSTPLSTQQQQRRLQHLQQNRNEGQYATARAYVVQARPPAQRRPVRYVRLLQR